MNQALADPMVSQAWPIAEVVQETADTFTMTLESPPEFRFEPGQFNMLYLFGIGESAISISGDPDRRGWIQHTTRRVGTVTNAMSLLKAGDSIGVRGPFGSAWPMEAAKGRDVAIVVGGIGLAPLRPAIYRILANRNEYGRVSLLYGARTQEDILYRKELEAWSARLDVEVFVTVDRATEPWHGNVGVVTNLVRRAPMDPAKTSVFICGPEIMMRFCVPELSRRGIELKNIHVSLERNMKCAIGRCGHCQFGPKFVCREGPVFCYDDVAEMMAVEEL